MIPAIFLLALSAPSGRVIPPAAHAAKAEKTAAERVAAANRSATEQPASRDYVNAVQVYPYREGAIYQAYVAPGAVTDIALQPGEALTAVAAGDTTRWVIGDTASGSDATRRTHILVKPHAAGLATNLVVTTDRRTYYLKLTATAATAMAALSWTYPADALIALRNAVATVPAASTSSLPSDIARLHFGYRITGDRVAWRPLRAFDDGRQTYVEFPPTIATGEAPPLFIVGAQGAAELVNYRMRGRFYVVDRIFDAAELRLGTKKPRVVRIERTGGDGTTGGDS